MPYLVSDSYPSSSPQPDEFVVTIDIEPPVIVIPQIMSDGGRRLHYDVSSASVGNHTVNVLARKDDPIWGWIESPSVPFAFTRPVLGIITGIGLEK